MPDISFYAYTTEAKKLLLEAKNFTRSDPTSAQLFTDQAAVYSELALAQAELAKAAALSALSESVRRISLPGGR